MSSTSSTLTGRRVLMNTLPSGFSPLQNQSLRFSFGQGEREYRADILHAFRPYATAVPGNDAVNDGEPDAGAPELLGAMQSLKYAKELFRVLHVEPDPVVAHGIVIFRAGFAAADLDERPLHLAAVLDRIGDEIGPYLAQQPPIAAGGRKRPHFNLRRGRAHAAFSARLRVQDFLDDLAHQRIDVHFAARNRLAPQSGKLQQGVDERTHPAAVLADHGQVALSFGIEALLVVLFHHLGEAVDGAQRRA